ncbi:flagellar basal-body rod protein FlgG [Pelagovum sp. HNIBRBA483]|uniref:flagellar basal-body rod protein FlgG n=1 Tax=Pelagovum sp. HNIBRBA483 TaxID=3233341 RepID=UPI0034A167E4
MRALKIAAAGMSAQQLRVEVTSNNLANMSTTGYNARRAGFADLHYQQVLAPGALSSATGTLVPTGVQLGLGVRASAVAVLQSQGALKQTGGELDLAIEGGGFLAVIRPDGSTAYTRDGALNRSPDGELVTALGFPVADAIRIPADASNIMINAEGTVYARFADRPDHQELGQIQLYRFANPQGLGATGDNLFSETAASGGAVSGLPGRDGLGTLRQGFLEESSVDPVREVTELIAAQRGYELNSKVISAADQMLGAMVQVR